MGSVGALWTTGYGRLVAVKVLSFAVVLLVAAGSHRAVRRWSAAPGAAPRLRRLVLTETAVVAVIIGVTAALVTSEPAVETYRPSFGTTVTATAPAGGRIVLDVLIRPTTPGFEGLTVHASDPSGREVPVEAAAMSFVNRGTGIGPIEFPAPVTPGQGVEDTLVSVPGPGTLGGLDAAARRRRVVLGEHELRGGLSSDLDRSARPQPSAAGVRRSHHSPNSTCIDRPSQKAMLTMPC